MWERLITKRNTALLAGFVVLCAAVCFTINGIIQYRAGQALDAVVSTLTFQMEHNESEIQQMEALSELTGQFDRRDSALYSRNFAKLYTLRADSDKAFYYFVDGQISAEIAKAYDIAAWLYADCAQLYINFYTYDLARECISNALNYAEWQPMPDFFYEYCYVTMAELAARSGDVNGARAYHARSLEFDSADLPEYQSMELRRALVLANISMLEGDAPGCARHMEPITDSLAEMFVPPLDVLWASGIYYPYLEMQAKLALHAKDYSAAIPYMDGVFAAGTLYGQMGRLMSFLSEVIALFSELDTGTMPPELQDLVERNTQKLILEYPSAFQDRNITAATHIHNANMVSIAVRIQEHQTKSFYALVAQASVIVALIIIALLWFWWGSEKRGRTDGLTGAYSRKYFNKVYDELKNSTASFGVIMYDIDFFKQINDGYGHEMGDTVLKGISQKVMSLLGQNAHLFRFGGDEFCVICKNQGLAEIADLAERIRASVERLDWNSDLRATLSIGVADAARGDWEVLLAADANLYRSKEAGRNRVTWAPAGGAD